MSRMIGWSPLAFLLFTVPAYAADDSSGVHGLLSTILFINLLPAIIAFARQHNSRIAILISVVVLDIFSWFIITLPLVAVFWFLCLIWSLTGNTKRRDRRNAALIASAMRDREDQWR
jgi:hypothetical protein